VSSPSKVAKFDDLISDVYRALLNRDPDEGAKALYGRTLPSGELRFLDFLRGVAESEEFFKLVLRRRDLSVFSLSEVARNSRYSELSSMPEYEALENDFKSISTDEFEEIFKKAYSSSSLATYREYVTLHKIRFREILSFVSAQSNKGGKMLEVSTSPYTPFVKKYYRGQVVTADHESIHPGKSGSPIPSINSDFHIAVDLNNEKISHLAKDVSKGGFDLVLFCEIIEHLLPSPFDIVRDLAECLKPGGRLLVTTPNFFSFDRVIKMMHRHHPSILLKPGDSFSFGAHHVREYSMDELIEVVRATGLKLLHFGFSDCWDQEPHVRDFVGLHPSERSCLMLVCERLS
jgi:SAM-dependent methyltransferase